MTTLTPKSTRRLMIAYLSSLVLKEALTQLAKTSDDDPLLAVHAETMMLDVSGLVEKLTRLMKVTETSSFLPLPEFNEFSIPEGVLKGLVEELVSVIEKPADL